jgi:hypothetical protein
MSISSEKRTILFTGYVAMGGVLTFEEFCRVADTAKASGFTHVDLGSAMRDRSRWQLDNDGMYAPGYDFYPEYTAAFADPLKFYCPKALQGHLPVDLIKQNGAELKRRAEYLAKIGLKGALIGAMPQFWPESVFEEHPDWRGPRCDMPFRSRRAYFSPCVDNQEVLDVFHEAVQGMHALAPNLDTLIFQTNDSGTGFCWHKNLYPGENGPVHCKKRDMAERVMGFLRTLEDAMGEGGYAYSVELGLWCYSGRLVRHPGNTHPENIWFVRPPQDKPVAFENPLGMLEELENAANGNPDIMVINIEQTQLFFQSSSVYATIFQKFRDKPTHGLAERILLLHDVIQTLQLDEGTHLLNAWLHLYRGIDDTSLRRLFYYSIFLYGCMSCRYLVRPFVPIPTRLTEEAKMYYKKHVFDSLDRQDYELDLLNIHGLRNEYHGRTKEEAERGVICWNSILSSLRMARAELELAIQNAGQGSALAYLKDFDRRIRALICFAVNLQNSEKFQAILDRAAETGYSPRANSDVLEATMRAELDNAQELIQILEMPEGRLVIPLASSPEKETTFLFGPNLTEQLRKKREIMLRYWRDSQELFQFKNRFNQ